MRVPFSMASPTAARSAYSAGSAGVTTAAPACAGTAARRTAASRTARIAAILPSETERGVANPFSARRRCQCMAPRRLSDTRADAERSFEQLYRGHRNDVYRAALRALGNSEDAEDVTQAAFVDAYRAVLRGTRPQAPRAWLLTIAENVRRRRFRTSLRRPREEPLDADAALAAEESHAQASSLLEALATLTTEQREAFLLREITGLSYDEIAAADGLDRRLRADAAVPRAADAPQRARPAARVRRALPADDAVLPPRVVQPDAESGGCSRCGGGRGQRERQRPGERRSRAREPGSDAASSRSSRCLHPHRSRRRLLRHAGETGAGAEGRSSEATRRGEGSDSRRRPACGPACAAAASSGSSPELPHLSLSRPTRSPSTSRNRRARARHRRRCLWRCRRCPWRCRRCPWRCRRCLCPRSRFPRVLEPVVEPLLEDVGAAGAAWAGALPLPVRPLDP